MGRPPAPSAPIGFSAHSWEFKARFRRDAFGWKSQPAITRIRQAVAEIQKVAKKDPVLAAEGAVAFLERVSPAIAEVDSSSGSIGTAVNNAIDALVPVIGGPPVDRPTRDRWLERLWNAYQADKMPYIEEVGQRWGDLCGSQEVASAWADRLFAEARESLIPEPRRSRYSNATSPCLSALAAAGRHEEILALLEPDRRTIWPYRQFGVRALAALGRRAEAIRFAEEEQSINDTPGEIARACEEILLGSGMAEEAYRRYGIAANQKGTYLATFRAVAKKYPTRQPAEILADLVKSTPGDEGKWFAAAKEAGLYDEAIALASRTPCDPKTLTRAARDFAVKEPKFAIGAGFLALAWIAEGYGYMRSLEQLLASARLGGRLVVLTADHGHVLDHDMEKREVPDEPVVQERSRSARRPAAQGEMLLRGRRVLAEEGAVVVPWSERVRYVALKKGYHGGASPQEAVVPFGVFRPRERELPGWEDVVADTPAWWLGPEFVPAGGGTSPGALSALKPIPGATIPVPQASTAARPEWIRSLLASPTFGQQRKRNPRVRLSDDQIADLLLALVEGGGKLLGPALARRVAVAEFRLPGLLAAAQQLLNVDAYAVLGFDTTSGTVSLNRDLLDRQFEVKD